MMGVGMASAAMRNVLRNNRNYLRKKALFKKDGLFLRMKPDQLKGVQGKVVIEQISEERLKKLRERIIRQQKVENIRTGIFLIISLIFMTVIFFQLISPTDEDKRISEERIAAIHKQKQDRYLIFVADGDQWLSKGKYHNAIFQYKKALEIFPSEYDALQRLAIGYSYQCKYKFKGCSKGSKLTKRLQKQFPNSEELQNIRAVFEHWGG